MTTSMFDSGIDSLIHGISHLEKFQSEREIKDLRFGLISIDNGFELLLKKCLIDMNVLVMKNWRTESVLDSLEKVRKAIEKSNLGIDKKNELKPFIYHNKLIILHNYRNTTYHVGSITKEEQLIELINEVLLSIPNFLKIFFDETIEQLNSYLSRITFVVYQLETEYNQLNKKRGQITDKQYLQQSYELLRTIIIHCSNHIFGEKDSYTNADLVNAIDKLKQLNELENTYIEDWVPTIKKMFIHVRDINESVNANLPVDDEVVKESFTDLNRSFSFFLEIYRLMEMGYIKKFEFEIP